MSILTCCDTLMIGYIPLFIQCDLVPASATKGWLRTLSKDYPTLAFHASINKSFGKVGGSFLVLCLLCNCTMCGSFQLSTSNLENHFQGCLLSVLRQFARLKSDKQAISVGFVGYPNVGKSSVINTLRSKTVILFPFKPF
jgi:nuclear GTP-binding protein